MFDSIVLSGGGVKGFTELGALHFFFENDYLSLSSIKELAGTSVGSAICLLINCGFQPHNIHTIFSEKSNFILPDENSNIFNIWNKTGLISVSSVINNIKDLIIEKLGCIPTFGQLYKKTKKTLYITGSNLDSMRSMVFSYKTTPDLSVLEAVKMSCNLPFIFQKITYNNEYITDGGLTNNFPYSLISKNCTSTLGIALTNCQVKLSSKSYIGYIFRLILLPTFSSTQRLVEDSPENIYVVEINTDMINALDFTMNDEQKTKLFSEGYMASYRTWNSIPLKINNL